MISAVPTPGALVGDTLFYVANTQVGPSDPPTQGDSLTPVLVLELPLACASTRSR